MALLHLFNFALYVLVKSSENEAVAKMYRRRAPQARWCESSRGLLTIVEALLDANRLRTSSWVYWTCHNVHACR